MLQVKCKSDINLRAVPKIELLHAKAPRTQRKNMEFQPFADFAPLREPLNFDFLELSLKLNSCFQLIIHE